MVSPSVGCGHSRDVICKFPLNALLIGERSSMAGLKAKLARVPGIIVGAAETSIEAAQSAMVTERFDLLFLSCELRNGDPFGFVQALSVDIPVVFYSSSDCHALRAFDVRAQDYLVMPISDERFADTIKRLKAYFHCRFIPSRVPNNTVFREVTDAPFSLASIVAIRAEGGNYTSARLSNGESAYWRRTLKNWLDVLAGHCFMQIHRQHIVNLSYVSALSKTESGRWHVAMDTLPAALPVSRRSLTALKKHIRYTI